MTTSVLARNRKPANVLHLIGSGFYGGPERQIIGHLRALDPNRYHGSVAAFVDSGGGDAEILEVARALELPGRGIPVSNPLDPRALSAIRRCLAELDIDLLCLHGYKAAVMGLLAARSTDLPTLAFSHGYTTENLKVAFYEWLERKALARLDGVVAVSAAQRRRLEDFGVACRSVWVVHNATEIAPVDVDRDAEIRDAVYREFSIPPDKMLAVVSGRLSPEKAHHVLLQAIYEGGDRLQPAYFLVCGDGPCREQLEQRALRLGLTGRCHFAGFRRDLERIHRAMDFMVLPSLTEGLPVVLLEAMACRKPVVATAVGGVPEIVDDGVNGFLVEAGDAGRLAAGIEKAIGAAAHFDVLGKAGFDRVQRQFSFARQAEKLQSIYDQLLAITESASGE